jgi:hypothetical protein
MNAWKHGECSADVRDARRETAALLRELRRCGEVLDRLDHQQAHEIVDRADAGIFADWVYRTVES